MLQSMTGHGQARVSKDNVQIAVEIRSVNNRHLKLNVHSDLDVESQTKVEALVRERIHRGSVSLRISVKSSGSGAYELNEELVRAYWLQLAEIAGSSQSVNVESVLALPGVVIEKTGVDPTELWPSIESAVKEALDGLAAMRTQEAVSYTHLTLPTIYSV